MIIYIIKITYRRKTIYTAILQFNGKEEKTQVDKISEIITWALVGNYMNHPVFKGAEVLPEDVTMPSITLFFNRQEGNILYYSPRRF